MSQVYNKVTLVGFLGKDAVVKTTAFGMSLAELTVATSKNVKKNDQWEQVTSWHYVVVFGKQAEFEYNKGSKIFIEGSIQYEEWEKDGEKKYRTKILADRVIKLDSKAFQQEKPSRAEINLNEDIPF